jgi:soluble lytic murein transglycosylase
VAPAQPLRDPLLDLTGLAEVLAVGPNEAVPPPGAGETIRSTALTRGAIAEAGRLLRMQHYGEAASLLQPLPPDPLIGSYATLLRLDALIGLGDFDGAEILAAQLGKSADVPAAELGKRRAAEMVLRRGGPVPPTQRPTHPTAAATENEAAQLLQQGEPGAALEVLRTWGPEERWSVQLEMLAARAAHALGNESEARVRWQRVAASEDPQLAAEAGIAWARSAESSGDLEGALGELARMSKDPRRGAEASYLAGRLQLQHGRTDDAVASLSLAASKRRQRFSDEARWWLGWVHFKAGRDDQAIPEWAALERGWPRSAIVPQALYWRARALDRQGRGAEAESIQRRLGAVAPGSYYALLANRAVPQATRVGPSERCADARPSGSDAFRVAYRRAALLQGLGLPELARGELDAAGRNARGPADSWTLAQLEAAVGETGRAFSRFNGAAGACLPDGWPSAPLFPRAERAEVESAARAAGIDPLWMFALMRRESRFQSKARSAASAAGLLQMLPVTGARIASVAGVARPDLGNPAESIWFGAWYLGALSERFGGDFVRVAAAYDAGPAPVASWLEGDRRFDEFVEEIPFRETRAYVKETLASLAAYRALYGSSDLRVAADSRIGAGPSTGVSF